MRYAAVPIAALLLAAAPAAAKEPQKPITDREVGAKDVAMTPMTDLNLSKDEIPQLLIDAQTMPYEVSELKRCAQIAAAVGELDALLGEDLDLPAQEAAKGPSAGRVAQYVVGTFIPFRGLVRELSGANLQQQRLQAAIQAGIARRSFLKGMGQARGCRYPARAATARDIEAYRARLQEAEDAKSEKKEKDAAKS